ncbi:basic salivary proline-rich protein 1-like [Phocoena sinus]|uniref:basic salivary proline-rich protein 1-like n=1 Tax=Phocoena sinus TaxID=42100 RepID=UPI0013C4FB35|nr:basic salivary proline-rich protein 1-like [Phocoena sinus]
MSDGPSARWRMGNMVGSGFESLGTRSAHVRCPKAREDGCVCSSREGPGGHPKGQDAIRPPGLHTGSHRQRPPAQGLSRGTQDANCSPRAPPPGAPLAGLRTTTANTHEPRPASDNTLPRAHRPPHGPHSHLRRARLPRLGNREHSTRGRRQPRRPGGRHPHVGEAGSVPDREGGAEGWGRVRAGGDGEVAARTHGEGCGAGARGARPGTGRAEARPGHQGNKRGAPPPHTRVRSHDARDAGRPQPPWGLPTPRPRRRGPFRPPRLAPQGNAPERGDPHSTRTPPPAATRGEGRRDGLLAAAGLGRRDIRASTPPWARHRDHRTRTHTNTRGPAPDAGLAGPSPDSERGWGHPAVGKERCSAPPQGRRKPSREGEGLCPRGLAVATVTTARLRGAAAGGPVPQGPLSDS